MAENNHGGYRRPSRPAPVSGPGALSARTDGGPTQPVRVAPGGEYGSRQEMEAIQSGAAMQGGGGMSAPAPSLPKLTDPTARPDEPITSGAAVGPGLSPQGAGILSDYEATNAKLRPYLRSLETLANLPGSNPETRTFVRLLKARLSRG